MKKRSVIRILLILFILILLLAGGAAFWGYRTFYSPGFAIDEPISVYIDEQTDYDGLCRQLVDSAKCTDIRIFNLITQRMDYPGHLKTGRYVVEPGMTHLALARILRNGQQTPVRITFNNIRTKEDLAEKLSAQLMFTKEDLLTLIDDEAYCKKLGFNPETIKCLFIPNTYEVYWNLTADKFMERMIREYNTFWNDERKEKAARIPLTPIEVSILASIVEEESSVIDEYPIIAGLYINRLKKGMPLQADPTVKYAVGDFTLRRILYSHLEVDSPYNTYLYTGLPPGPLRIPSIQGLNSVLNYARHNYLYMVAKEDFSGRHNFAVSLAEHNRNADRYRQELNRRGIR